MKLKKECDDLKELINYITRRELSDDYKIARRSGFESEQYIVDNDTLFHLYIPRIKHMDKANKSIKQLVIPKQCSWEVLNAHHDQNWRTGIARLYETLRQ